MKNISKVLRIVAVATILSLLVITLPASPALAAERLYLDPDDGEIGDRIDVTGSGFPASNAEEESVYIFLSPEDADVDDDDIDDLDTYHRVRTTYTDDEGDIDTYFTVPSRLTTGDDDEDVHGGTYYVYATTSTTGRILVQEEFTVMAAEIELDSDEGAVGTEVEITGKDFNDREEITVEYDDDEVDIESGDDETDSRGEFTCTIIIPESIAGEHTIMVTDETGSEAEATFDVESEITLTPASGAAGDTITVEGTGFGDELDFTIEFDGDEVATDETDTDGSFQITFVLPVKSPGTYKVEAEDDDRNKASKNLAIAAGIKLSPTTGNVGTEITVSGSGFAPNATVTITYAPVSSPVATPNADANGKFLAKFSAPESTHGNRTITATDGTNTATATFSMESTKPPIPVPLLPQMEEKAKSRAFFDWEEVTDPSGVTYSLQIATDEEFTEDSIVFEKTDIAESEYTMTGDDPKLESTKEEAPYYWRVRAVDGAENASGWTAPGSFYVGFTFELTGWVLYLLMGIAGVLLLMIGFLLGKRTIVY